MSIKTESRTLVCQLSDHELIERGDELAKTYMKVAALDMEKKRITARIKPLDERIELLVTIIDTKEEEREVDCEWQYDFGANVKRLRRLDTGEVIDTKEIKDWERQQQLALETAESNTLTDLADVCPKCDGDGKYYDDGEGGGETYCDCPAGRALKEKEELVVKCGNTACKKYVEGVGDNCSSPTTNLGEPVTDCADYKPLQIKSQCAVCLGLCGDFTPGTQVSGCPGFSAEPSAEMINHRDTVCMDEWRECHHANACFGPANEDGPCDCIKNILAKEPKAAPESDKATTLKEAREKRAKLIKTPKGGKK